MLNGKGVLFNGKGVLLNWKGVLLNWKGILINGKEYCSTVLWYCSMGRGTAQLEGKRLDGKGVLLNWKGVLLNGKEYCLTGLWYCSTGMGIAQRKEKLLDGKGVLLNWKGVLLNGFPFSIVQRDCGSASRVKVELGVIRGRQLVHHIRIPIRLLSRDLWGKFRCHTGADRESSSVKPSYLFKKKLAAKNRHPTRHQQRIPAPALSRWQRDGDTAQRYGDTAQRGAGRIRNRWEFVWSPAMLNQTYP